MLGIFKIIIFFLLQNILVQCLIPGLSVRTLNKQLIQRKRQDTLEMCLKFNAENERLKRYNNPGTGKSRRVKRSIDPLKFENPVLNDDEVKRVENIVDRLYDDLEEKGEHVIYRQKKLKPTVVKSANKTSRRFDFAPAFLLGPQENTTNVSRDDRTPFVPWHKYWKHGIIPFFIDPKTYDSHLAEKIISAFDYFERATCIRLQRLREKPTDYRSLRVVNWIFISNPFGIRQCVHSNAVKRNMGVQMIVFGYDCMSVGEIAHEIMHVLGFSHVHTRPDRDQYVTILWDNIKPGYKKYFETRTKDTLMNLPYDYNSVLHYPSRAFSKNGQVTVLTQGGIKVGQRLALSEIDVEKVGLIFGNHCVDRNRDYLLKTCPSVIKGPKEEEPASSDEIQDYFKDRIWSYGVVNYKMRDKMEFSAEERENIRAVIRHIEKETCIEFRDLSADDDGDYDDNKQSGKNNKTSGDSAGTSYVPDRQVLEESSNIVVLDENAETQKLKHEVENEINDDDSTEENGIDSANETVSFTKAVLSSEENRLRSNNKPHILRRSQSINKKTLVLKNAPKKKQKKTTVKIVRSKPKQGNVRVKRVRRAAGRPKTPSRRHADSILVLTRSPYPGCPCPTPGKPKGDQVLEINTDCFNSVNDLLHLFVHVLGLDHQHNMHDRDSFLHIAWNLLTPDIKKEMQQKLPPAASVGFPYDYQSVTHYPWLNIKNGVTSIMYPIWNDGWAMGHWQGLSSTDVHKLNLLYFKQCSERKKHALAEEEQEEESTEKTNKLSEKENEESTTENPAKLAEKEDDESSTENPTKLSETEHEESTTEKPTKLVEDIHEESSAELKKIKK